jgi:hypothetical protein
MPPEGGGAAIVEGYAVRAPDAILAVAQGEGRLGAAQVRDSARRRWIVEARRDAARGRTLVLSPVQGDLEPFRCAVDGHRPDTHLAVSATDWTLLALLVAGHDGGDGRDDEALRQEAFRTVDRLVREAQHRVLMGAAEDEDDEG